MMDAYSRCFSSRAVPVRRVRASSMPCMGVLISWLMLARNSDLILDDSSNAEIRRASAAFRSVRSRVTFAKPTWQPPW